MASGLPYTSKPATDLFSPEATDIDRRKCTRITPMRVLALGLGRTGTASLRVALKELGYETYHMMNASVENPPDCLVWQDALAAKFSKKGSFGRKEWDALLGHANAVSDWPAVAFAEELIDCYPEAKVILTQRNVDSWYASVMRTVYWRVNDPELKALSAFDWHAGLYYPMLRNFWDCFFGAGNEFERTGKQRYLQHYDEVRNLVPRERLLELNVASGWEPLCEFLGEPIPATPFPRSNDTDAFVLRCRDLNRRLMMNVLLRALVVGAPVLATFISATMAYNYYLPQLPSLRIF